MHCNLVLDHKHDFCTVGYHIIGTWIIAVADLYNVSSVCVSHVARENSVGSANCFEFYRIFASKPRSDCVAGKSGTCYPCVVQRHRIQSLGSSRNSTASATKQELHAYRLLWGIRVDTSYRKYLTHTLSDRQDVTYLTMRSSCTVRCNQRFH